MSDRLVFPDEPIRVPADRHLDGSLAFEDEHDPDARSCMTCRGEGWEWCEDTNSSEGCWEPDCDGEAHTCPNCYGSGDAKDQRFW